MSGPVVRPAAQPSRPGNNLVTITAVLISNSRHPGGVKLIETLIIYENKTHISANRRRSAKLDYNSCFCAHAWLTNDDAGDADSATPCVKDDDGDASVL
jgi:hypothetical protein